MTLVTDYLFSKHGNNAYPDFASMVQEENGYMPAEAKEPAKVFNRRITRLING